MEEYLELGDLSDVDDRECLPSIPFGPVLSCPGLSCPVLSCPMVQQLGQHVRVVNHQALADLALQREAWLASQ